MDLQLIGGCGYLNEPFGTQGNAKSKRSEETL